MAEEKGNLLPIDSINYKKISDLIIKNRKLFISYNILRLRELIRYLSDEKLDLFNTIPLMLHLNHPHFPGYVESDAVVHGIINFQYSGFYTQALQKNRMNEEVIKPYTTSDPVITSLLHIGSAGTLTQSEKSDFDYWVIIDRKKFDEKRLSILQKKLFQIESYCYKEYRQEVTFFIHDDSHIRNNNFATVGVSSYGLAPKTLLKEEFYRTFIMIAGKIPYWAVFPANMDDQAYDLYVREIRSHPVLRRFENEYVDLGNLSGIDTRECLGVILWQIYKAKDDPVKSLVKASLIANYYFDSGQGKPLLCNIIKNHFHHALLDHYQLDPYALVFETICNFYRNIIDSEGFGLIKSAIFLRLCGFPFVTLPDEESPKRRLLKKYVQEWGMDRETVHRLLSYYRWPEIEKLSFDEAIFKKLSFLFELILRNQDEKLMGIQMNSFDLSILKNRISAYYTKKPGKVPRCSTWLTKMWNRVFFLVTDKGEHISSNGWHIYGSIKKASCKLDDLLFQDAEFLKVIGWMIANRLNAEKIDNVCFNFKSDLLHEQGDIEWFNTVHQHMTQCTKTDESSFLSEPKWGALYLLLKPASQDHLVFPCTIELMAKNSWDEYYCDTVDLSYIEKKGEKYYKIATIIWAYMMKSSNAPLKYKLVSMGGEDLTEIETSIAAILHQYREDEKNKKERTQEGDLIIQIGGTSSETRPFLDVIESPPFKKEEKE